MPTALSKWTGRVAAGTGAIDACLAIVGDTYETDVDCGGSCLALDEPQLCAHHKACRTNSDCTSANCNDTVSMAPTCSDGVANGNETDVDCGGTTCSFKCAAGTKCSTEGDCDNTLCTSATSRICMAATCDDGEQNGGESSIDCGGFCFPCPDNNTCSTNSDCQSGKCDSSANTCAAASCDDGVKNGDEVGVDCAGSGCDEGCAVGHVCTANADCASTLCYNGNCLDQLCSDLIHCR